MGPNAGTRNLALIRIQMEADLFIQMGVEQFEQAIREWTSQLSGVSFDDETLQAVSIDGKTLCGTLQRHQRSVHLLSALDHQTGYVLSQARVDSKTNEAKAVLMFLKQLVLQGKFIVGEDRYRVRRGSAPQVLAGIRNLVMNWLRSQKTDNIAQALRKNAWNPQPLFTKLKNPNHRAALGMPAEVLMLPTCGIMPVERNGLLREEYSCIVDGL